MKVSIIIPIFNKREYTQKCLESIFLCGFGSEHGDDFEVIVVDNGSTDDSFEYLSGLNDKVTVKGKVTAKDRVVVIRNEKNLGFAKACNQGAGAAKGEYLMFLNNDTIVTKGWLDILVKELDQDSHGAIRKIGVGAGTDTSTVIDAVGPKLLYPDNTIQHAGVVFDEKKWPHHIYKKEPKDAPYVNKKRQFQCITAACLLIRAEVFRSVGGFDEAYVNGLEDLDLCLKIRELGFGILYVPESIVYHYESITEGRSNYDERNVQLFYSRWKNKIKIDYKAYEVEDGMNGMGEFIDSWRSSKFSYKKFHRLLERFVVTAKRDGFVNAVAKVWRRTTMKMPVEEAGSNKK